MIFSYRSCIIRSSRMHIFLYLILIFCAITIALAYPNGPPIGHMGFRSLCTDMSPKPGHTHEPQVNTPSPYKITLNHDSYVHTNMIQGKCFLKEISGPFCPLPPKKQTNKPKTTTTTTSQNFTISN